MSWLKRIFGQSKPPTDTQDAKDTVYTMGMLMVEEAKRHRAEKAQLELAVAVLLHYCGGMVSVSDDLIYYVAATEHSYSVHSNGDGTKSIILELASHAK